jgi:outer membrane protein TolC
MAFFRVADLRSATGLMLPGLPTTQCRVVPYRMRFLLIAFLLAATTASAQTRSTASVSPPFLGGVPSGTVSATPLNLTILETINRALQHNLGVLNAEEAVDRAKGIRWNSLADLLPNINGHLTESGQVINLAAFGFNPAQFGFPNVVGPFNLFDARVAVSQSILDVRALNSTRAETHNVLAAQFTVKSARELVVLVSANLYLQALAARARTESARAQMQTAETVFQQASNMKDNGLVAGIDVLRADVQLATERQRVTAAQNEFEKTKLQLARVIGLPVGQAFELVEELPYVPVPDMTLDSALERAYQTRPDYQAALERVRAAEAARRAIAGELMPAVRVNADYGPLGITPADTVNTYTVSGTLSVPIFNGHIKGRLAEADSDLRTRRSEAEDLKAGIYYDVKNAFLDLQATAEQLQVATRARDLASQQLVQARDRFTAGVTNNVEVVQAQEAVALASEQYIAALYGYNVAKALLARGLGIAEDATRQLLGGAR